MQIHPDAELIRNIAAASTDLTSPWESGPTVTTPEVLANIVIYPKGRTLDADLLQLVTGELNDPKNRYLWMIAPGAPMAGLFVDLSPDSSGTEEFVLLGGASGVVYQKGASGWREAGHAYESDSTASQKDVLAKLTQGDVSIKEAAWKELWIGNHRIRVQ